MTDARTQRTGPVVSMRPARMDDAQRLLDWRNHPSTREQSLDRGEIGWEGHVTWLARVLKDPDTLLRIGVDDDGTPVGMVRVDRDALEAVYSVIVDPAARGGGVGAQMMLAMESEIMSEWPEVTTMVATILAENHASQKMVRSIGWEIVSLRVEKPLVRGEAS